MHFVNTWLNVFLTTNRWLTFLLAVKRYRAVFDIDYALQLIRRSARTNFRRCVGFGFVGGVLQGLVVSLTAVAFRVFLPDARKVPAIVLALHPLVVTPTMTYLTVAIILKIRADYSSSSSSATSRRRNFGGRLRKTSALSTSASSTSSFREFQLSIVVVCVFFVLSQYTNLLYFIARGLKSHIEHDAFFYGCLLTMLNSCVHFFVYFATSKKFRVALKQFVWDRVIFGGGCCCCCCWCWFDVVDICWWCFFLL